MTDWSFSRIDHFRRCPFSWKCKYLDRIPEPESEAFQDGKLFHNLADAYAKQCLKLKRGTDWDFARTLADSMADRPSVRELFLRFAVPRESGGGAWVFDVDNMTGTEEFLSAQLPNGDTMRGRIDYLAQSAGTATITDWKTSWAYEKQADEAPQQLLTYAWLVQQCYPSAQEFVLRYHYARKGVVHEWEVYGPQDPAPFVAAIESIKAETEFKPIAGGHCANCSFTTLCPVLSTAYPENDIHGAAEKVIVLRAEANRLAKLVQAWTKENGTLWVNGIPAGYDYPKNPSPRVLPDKIEGFLAYLSSVGVDWLPEVTFAEKTISMLRKQWDGVEDYLETPQGELRFDFRKADGE